jgi:type II secretory ATPase GspE/PulE/Tfp pilus assembly ATPase PilB-like protein
MIKFFSSSKETNSAQQVPISLLDKMYENNILNDDAKNLAMREIQQNNTDPIRFLHQAQLIDLDKVENFLLTHFGIPSIDLININIDSSILKLSSVEQMIENAMLPFKIDGNMLCVAMEQPYLIDKVKIAEELFKGVWVIHPYFCKNMRVSEAIDYQLTHADEVEPLIAQLCSSPLTQTNQIVSPDHIIIKLVEGFLLEALQQRASDIHFDSNPYFTQQRLRVDGVLIEKRKLNLDIWNSVKIRLKVLSNIDITENHLPQDGSFFIRLRGNDYDFRLSSLPSIHGESIVLRLNSHKSIVALPNLGFDQNLNTKLKALIKQPSGLILISGPTGSGKTTTLYALLKTLQLNKLNVATLEDPVEHIVPDIRQTNVRPELGLDFAQGIRSLLRQDPDILLIGEIRDSESAELAIKAALTGHLVLATIHAAYIKDIPNRMKNLLESSAAFYSQTLAIMAQRLLRKLCTDCYGTGCQKCNQSGYYGRFAIMEHLIFDQQKLSKVFSSHKYKSLQKIANDAVNNKLTDHKEVERVMGASLN